MRSKITQADSVPTIYFFYHSLFHYKLNIFDYIRY